MVEYTTRILSFLPEKIDVVQQVLACPTISKLIFPATLPTAPGKEVHFTSIRDYDISLIPKEFYRESFASIPLYGDNGIEFGSIIYFAEKPITPNVLNFKFTSEHFAVGVVTLADLKALIAEAIPIFEADDVSVYDQWRPQIVHPDGSIMWEQPKYFKGSDGKPYSLELEWLTYYGPKMLKVMGRKRFEALHTCAEKIELNGGILVVLQEEPFDRKNPEHMARKAKAEAELGIQNLIKSG